MSSGDSTVVRNPTADKPLTNEEVIDALIVLRKGLLAAGYSYDAAMNAMKQKMAAKLLKTVPVEDLKKDIIDTILSVPSVPPIAVSIPPLHTNVIGGARTSLSSSPSSSSGISKMIQSYGPASVNPFETFSATPAPNPVGPSLVATPLVPPSHSAPSPAMVNPFDVEIMKRKTGPTSAAGGEPSDHSTSTLSTSFEDARLKRTYSDNSKLIGRTASGSSHTADVDIMLSSPSLTPSVTPSLSRTGSYRSDLTDPATSSLVRTGSHRGLLQQETTSPSIADQNAAKGLLRTSSKKGQSLTNLNPSADPNATARLLRPGSFSNNSLTTVPEEGSNPLQSYRSGSLSARGGDREHDLVSRSLSLSVSEDDLSHSLLSVSRSVPTSTIPLAPKSGRLDMFQREDSNQSSGSNASSAASSGPPSASSSLSAAGFDILLKRSSSDRASLDEFEAQQHVVKALQDHEISNRQSGHAAHLRRTPSIEKEDFRLHNTPSPNIAISHSRRLSKTYSDRDEGIFSSGDHDSSSDFSSPASHRLQSPSVNISGTGTNSQVPHPSHPVPPLSLDLPPQPEFLSRTSSKGRVDLQLNLAGISSTTNTSNSIPVSSLAKSVPRSGADYAHENDIRHKTAPPMALSLDGIEPTNGVDPVGSARALEQIMKDPFWEDIEPSQVPLPPPPSVPPKSRNPSATPATLAGVVAAATQAMSELDALMDIDEPTANSSTKKTPPQHQQQTHHHHHHSHHRASEEKVILDESDEIVSAFKTAVPMHVKPPVGRSQSRSPAVALGGSIAETQINLDDYPAIKRKLDEMSIILRNEGVSAEDIADTIRSQSIADLKEIKEIDYFRILVQSSTSNKTVHSVSSHSSDGDSKERGSKTPVPTVSATSPAHSTMPPRVGLARLVKDVRITVRYPEKLKNSSLVLSKGCTYMDVLTTVMADVSANVSSPIMYIVDSQGWCREVTREGRYSNHCEFSLFDLSDGMVVEIRELATASIGGRFRMALISDADRNNESLYYKVKNLCKSYAGYRKIRGDGNCYYRAVVYGALEQIIKDRNRQAFRFMYETFKSVLFSNRDHNADHNDFLAALAAAAGV